MRGVVVVDSSATTPRVCRASGDTHAGRRLVYHASSTEEQKQCRGPHQIGLIRPGDAKAAIAMKGEGPETTTQSVYANR